MQVTTCAGYRTGVAEQSTVRVERSDGVLWLRLHHPQSRNALSVEDLQTLAHALRDDVRDPADRCAVITGHEPGSFCSGFRLDESAAGALQSGTVKDAADQLFRLLPGVAIPVIAAVDGPALGAGCELALRCDLRIASDRAGFGIPAARLGIPYTPPSVEFLTRRFGQAAVAWLFYAGARLDAKEALRLGLLHQVVRPKYLGYSTTELTSRITASAPLVLGLLKAAVAGAEGAGSPDAVAAAFARATASEDFAETLRAIAERREPDFTGR
jgi:enoyl-CoA hydratase/carnithine racemase